jgi:taurine transport system permease protein
VSILVYPEDVQLTDGQDGKPGKIPAKPSIEPGEGFAKNDALVIARYGSKLISVFSNDEFKKPDGVKVTHLNGQAIAPGEEIILSEGRLALTDKGTPFFEPAKGFRMARLYLRALEVALDHFLKLNKEGNLNSCSYSIHGLHCRGGFYGFLFGCLAGHSLGLCHGAYELGLWPV